jgi:tetratricopeptide (TPR) repeat protein
MLFSNVEEYNPAIRGEPQETPVTRTNKATDLQRQAQSARAAGRNDKAISFLQQAVVTISTLQEDEQADDRLHGQLSRELAELLVEENRVPEAMQAYQEATDAFGRAPGSEAEAQECAQKILAGVRDLWKQPQDRLLLLIAHYEREIQQLAGQSETEARQGEIAFKMATVLNRRDRFQEAGTAYRRSLELYERAPETGLQQASCHHRLADLYHHELDDDILAAVHYRHAMALYSEFEPLSEGEQMNRTLCEWHLNELLAKGAEQRR